jgi:DNA-binding response OmpR family regulator
MRISHTGDTSVRKILIVEDDDNIAKMIAATVSIAGYEHRVCSDGKEAVGIILGGDFDLVLLDVMLPGMDGFEIIQNIRDKGTPVIFLTAMQDISDKVKGLRLGAEDYIVKPFEAVELLARIEVVLRRFNKGRNVLKFEHVAVDLEKHIATKDGVPVTLTPKEFDVLVLFMQNIDIALTRDRLLAAVWGYLYQGESRTVDIHVQQVRRKMGLQNSLITVPKLGYRLESTEA